MLDEAKLKMLLQTQTEGLRPRPELWARVAQQTRGRRQAALTSGLRRGLELVAACAVIGSIALLPWLRHSLAPVQPGGNGQPAPAMVAPQSVPGVPQASEVAKAYFAGYPGADHAALDAAVVGKVIGWLQSAQVVGTDKDLPMREGKDFYLVLELQNGASATVRIAEDCVITRGPDSTSTTCHRAEGQVNLITSGNEAPRLRGPELAHWLLAQATHRPVQLSIVPQAPPLVVGARDLQDGSMQAIFSAPTTPTKFTPEKAREVAAKQIGDPPADAKVYVEYVLLSLRDAPVIGGKKIERYPVYLITYDGVVVAPSGGLDPATGKGPHAGIGKVTAILDANTGEWIMGVMR